MPRKLKGKKLTKKEHKQWKAAHAESGSGAIATAAVKKSRAKKKRKPRKGRKK